MKVAKQSKYIGLSSKRGKIDPERIEPIIRDFDGDLETIFTALQKRIRFGSGADASSENVSGEFIVYTSNASANTEDTIAHNLDSIPVGYIVVKQDAASNVYEGTTAWTSTNVYLRQSGTSVGTTIFLLK